MVDTGERKQVNQRWWPEMLRWGSTVKGLNIQLAAGTVPISGASPWGARIQQLPRRPEGQNTSVLLCSWLAI